MTLGRSFHRSLRSLVLRNDCPTDLVCSGGCYCKKGFKRDGKLCVPEAQCPAKCEGPNEVYSTCGNDCTDLCPDPNRLCTQECYGGCFCAEGYSRVDYSSPCIPTDECPKTCPGKNEQYYECGNSCFDSCPDPSQNCNLNCVQGCFCRPNYARLVPGGPCVPNTKCPNPCPRPFEELNNCGNNCTELCPRYGRVCDRNCWKDCFCEDGYYRPGYNEPCIPKSKCPVLPVCKGPNEEIRDCGSRCDDDCPGIIYECPNDCQVGCYCKPGFKRLTRDGQCVPVDKCPSVCTKANEEFTECGSPCREACQYPDALCTDECYLGCYCQAGYSRINGECVPSSECPSVCSDPNEFYTQCGNRCGELCNSVNCPTVCEVGCFCKPGFKRDSLGGKCIPEKQCTLSCTKPNEEYTDCGNPCTEGCPYPTRVCPAVCYTGCYCKAGYSRIKGKCVSSSNCPNLCTNPNEVFSECGSHCAEECNSEACPEICETGCFCQPGYSRKDGVCVPTEECPPKCEGFNEVYTDCGSSCREQCGQKFCPDICEEGCFCAPGYSRIKGVCTETISCPKCAKNEEYTYCASGCTDPCNLKDALCKDVCREGCFCKDNYSRVTPGAPCIPDSQCPDIPPPVTSTD
uniref:TIL domain-containing protein n=1 Tax=Phlebotomus papatasi TaxID=29031 RepID=A0A1B0CYU8_PHLPP